jgi:IS4 transposase
MYTKYIDTQDRISENISANLEQITFNSVRKVLPDSAIIEACKSAGYCYRQRTITPIVTILHMLLAAIWPQESFAASWQVLWAAFSSKFVEFAGCSPSLGSVAKARSRIPLAVWNGIFKWMSNHMQEVSARFDTWRGHRVLLLDGTCVSMPDVPELFEEFGTPTGYHGKCKYPLARLVTLCLANTMTVLDYALGRYDQGEHMLAHPLLKNLQKGDLLIADRHFAAAHFYWYYMSIGLEFLTMINQRLKMSSIKRIESYSQNDFLGWLQINKKYRRNNPLMPDRIMIRFVKISVCQGGRCKTVWFVTSLLDENLYPAKEIAELYGKRWRIETLFKEVKVNLSADVLRSLSPYGIKKEVASRLIAVNIVRVIMLEAAAKNGIDPLRISFIHAVRAILCFAPALACEPIWQLPQIYMAMLTEIGTHLVPERPGRKEPRAVTRERKHYPKLRKTREQWRTAYAA